jgi:hypothetical protein
MQPRRGRDGMLDLLATSNAQATSAAGDRTTTLAHQYLYLAVCRLTLPVLIISNLAKYSFCLNQRSF